MDVPDSAGNCLEVPLLQFIDQAVGIPVVHSFCRSFLLLGHRVVAALVVDTGSGMFLAGFACGDAMRAVFPSLSAGPPAGAQNVFAGDDALLAFAGDDASRAVSSSIGVRPNSFGIMIGMD